jgi:ADP-heptose:LPS heptosyltransferase
VHAGAGSPAKRWAAAGFADVVGRWRAAGGDVIEIVGPADGAVPPIADRRAIDWELDEVVALLARVDAYVGNDSGVTHLAGAAGARGIAVFGPTAARRWAPATDAIGALQAVESSAHGIDVSALAPERVWRVLESCGCLDKLRDRT